MKKKGARILVMDDEPEMVRLLQRTIIAHDFQVCTMTNAEDPPEACMQYRPDVLLLGLDGPGSNGLEVCQQVRMRSSIPIIVLSSNGRECDKVRALDLGADDYVCTPFGVQDSSRMIPNASGKTPAPTPPTTRPASISGSEVASADSSMPITSRASVATSVRSLP